MGGRRWSQVLPDAPSGIGIGEDLKPASMMTDTGPKGMGLSMHAERFHPPGEPRRMTSDPSPDRSGTLREAGSAADRPVVGFRIVLAVLAGMAFSGRPVPTRAAEPSRAAPSYETDVRPLLEAKCLRCHGPKVKKAELDLSAVATILQGGESGPVVDPRQARGEPALRDGPRRLDARRQEGPAQRGGGRHPPALDRGGCRVRALDRRGRAVAGRPGGDAARRHPHPAPALHGLPRAPAAGGGPRPAHQGVDAQGGQVGARVRRRGSPTRA